MKIACVYHRIDLDGWMSAAIVKYWFEQSISTLPKMQSIGTGYTYETSTLSMVGYNNNDEEPDLSKYDKVIMCDISLSLQTMYLLLHRLQGNFIWIDHHISKILDIQNEELKDIWKDWPHMEGIRDTKFAACELTWQYFFPEQPMPEFVRLLGRYDCFGSIGTEEEEKVFEFQYGARAIINNHNDAYKYLKSVIEDQPALMWEKIVWERGKFIYEYLKKEAQTLYRSGFPIELQGKKFICINRGSFNPATFKIDCHKDGYKGVAIFHYADGKWRFSLYNEDGSIDCSEIAKAYGGGGHMKAAGFVVDNINDIIKKDEE